MQQLEEFIINGQQHKVCKLIKLLYRLKQAPKQQYKNFDKTLVSKGFKVIESDRCVYSRFNGIIGVLIYLYFDGLLIFRTDETIVKEIKFFLGFIF